MRWPTVFSGTSRARAISPVVSPPTARRVSATCETVVSDGWQHSNSRVSESSTSVAGGGSTVERKTASSRLRRAASWRISSMRRRAATVISQFFG